jgi:hypothetical protein
MPAQRAAADDLRSAFPRRAGVPWWGAVLIAVSATLVGVAIEAGSGNQELGAVFATCYALGCIGAALAVRQSSIFTAVVQPPLLLFVAVPLAYFLFHSAELGGLKDILITCGYPLIERFPLMLFTSAAALLVGMSRWFLAASPSGDATADGAAATPLSATPSRFAGLAAALSTVFTRSAAEARETPGREARPRHGTDRAPTANRRPARRPPDPVSARPRHARRPLEEFDGRPAPRRRPADEPAPPRRRPRPAQESGRTPPPPRRTTRGQRDDLDQYPPRTRRGNPYEPTRGYLSEPTREYPSREPYPPYPPAEPRRRPGAGGSSGTHHPVSRVRYRDSGPAGVDERDSYRNRSGR